MVKRDPEKTARNVMIKGLTAELKNLLPQVLKDTGIKDEASLHARYGGKYADYIDIKHAVIHSPQGFMVLYLKGFKEYVNKKASQSSRHRRNYEMLSRHSSLKGYLLKFFTRSYYREYEALSKNRPKTSEACLWIGQKNAKYGLLVTPRFNGSTGQWENDKSEIRHFPKKYWTIGHVLETGLCVPGKDSRIKFSAVDDYLKFFEDVLVRLSGSQYEAKLAELYSEYVRSSEDPHSIPLLIPELRYGGPEEPHQYRLDFCIIGQNEFKKVGIELSPWSTHGYLKKVKKLTQKEINRMACDNFEKEMKKHKKFFFEYGISTLIFTNSDLKDMDKIFESMVPFFEEKAAGTELQFQIIDELLG